MAERDRLEEDGLGEAGDKEEAGANEEEGSPRPMILIVVGAHLRAEAADRPIAYALREKVLAWLDARGGAANVPAPATPGEGGEGAEAGAGEQDPGLPRPGHPCTVVVCTDVWYLNDASLRVWPTISVGGPGVNALSAYLADKLPGVLVVDDVLMIQMDPELRETTAAVWGVDHRATVSAAEAFAERYLDGFLNAATSGWWGEE